jgi:hypothetical protein
MLKIGKMIFLVVTAAAGIVAGGFSLRATTAQSATAADTAEVARRLREIEDKLAIYEIIAAHPPSADTGAGYYTRFIYMKDATFDRGGGVPGATGNDAIAGLIENADHKKAIAGGLAHFAGLPLIELRGDEAYVTSYLQVISLDHEGQMRELPNHASTPGYRIHTIVANRWHLVRTAEGWRIQSRKYSPLNGTALAREILSQGLERYRTN